MCQAANPRPIHTCLHTRINTGIASSNLHTLCEIDLLVIFQSPNEMRVDKQIVISLQRVRLCEQRAIHRGRDLPTCQQQRLQISFAKGIGALHQLGVLLHGESALVGNLQAFIGTPGSD